MSILHNKLFSAGIVIVLVAALGYYVWSSGGESALLTTGGESTSPLSQEILTTLSQLHTLRLEPAIFTDPTFVSLTDFGVTIPPQNAGRRNPFAPLGNVPAGQ